MQWTNRRRRTTSYHARNTNDQHRSPPDLGPQAPCRYCRKPADGLDRLCTSCRAESACTGLAKYAVVIVVTSPIVGIPLAYGVFNAVKAALQLFG